MTCTLVLLAAGLGSRFGGPKQLVPVGPHREPLFVLTAREALGAGFDRVVVVTRDALGGQMGAVIADQLDGAPVELVVQDRGGPSRPTPWGTGHAIARCAPLLDGPVGVANADDFYGVDALRRLGAATTVLGDHEAVIVGYRLGDTLSDHGPVNRAVLGLDDGLVVAIAERRGLRRVGPSIVDGGGAVLDPDTPVSMNLLGLGAAVPALLVPRFEAFAAIHIGDDVEMVLPDELAALLAEGRIVLRHVPGGRVWVGLTAPDDLADVRAMLSGDGPAPVG